MKFFSSWLSSFRKGPTILERRRHSSFRPRLEQLEDRSVPSANGPLDTTFSGDGIASPPSGISFEATLIQPDGKVLGVGRYSAGIALARYTTSGGLDSSFGSSGLAKTKASYYARDAALQADGKILAAGGSFVNGSDGILARYKADGPLDTAFGKKGIVSTSFNINGIVVQADGKIVVAGFDGARDWRLARYTTAGKLDTTFGSSGTVVTDISDGSADFIHDLAIDEDGKVVVAGYTQEVLSGSAKSFALGRYNTNGTLDTSFGTDGIVTTTIDTRGDASNNKGDEATNLAIHEGKIVAIGYGSTSGPTGVAYKVQMELARYNSDGSLDTSFGNSGTVSTTIDGEGVQGWDVAIQADGKIVAAGQHVPSGASGLGLLARYNADGSLDTSFNDTGMAVTTISRFVSVAIDPTAANEGKIVTAGGVGLARYVSATPEIGSFTGSPNPVTAGSSTTLTAFDVTTDNAGGTVSKVSFYRDANANGQFDEGTDTLLGDGVQSGDDWSFGYTPSTAAIDTLFARAQDSYGIWSDALALELTVS